MTAAYLVILVLALVIAYLGPKRMGRTCVIRALREENGMLRSRFEMARRQIARRKFGEDRWEFYEDAAGEHRWRRLAANNEIVAASSEGFTTYAACLANAVRCGYGLGTLPFTR